jgi:hypothetical protein
MMTNRHVLADLLSDGLLMDTDNGERCDAAGLAALNDLIAASAPSMYAVIVHLVLLLLPYPALIVGAMVMWRNEPWVLFAAMIMVAVIGRREEHRYDHR